MTSSRLPVCAIAGVGPGNGAALVKRFAQEGYGVAMLARTHSVMEKLGGEVPNTRPYCADLADADAVTTAFARIATDLGPVDVLIYNAGKRVPGSAEDVSLEEFETSWRVNTLGAFAAARCVIPAMKAKGAGQIVFIGATASLRGGAQSAAFAPGKAAQRSLAQSLARSLGPSGIHVSLIIVDGIVDEPKGRAAAPGRPQEFFIKPEDVAAAALMLTQQARSGWTFELDLRPFGEKW